MLIGLTDVLGTERTNQWAGWLLDQLAEIMPVLSETECQRHACEMRQVRGDAARWKADFEAQERASEEALVKRDAYRAAIEQESAEAGAPAVRRA